ncbi:MAG: DUF2510 domain-containing protein [Kineosporiaceae bacterium]|nr:DUF2510 domain-containing protein [Kineosporiaceae bacterium]
MSAAPGWYPDPQGGYGQLRYWDGTSWTSHTTMALASQPPTPQPPQPTPAPPQPWSPGQGTTLPLDPGDAAGPPSPPVPPHSSWTQGAGPTAGGFDPHALMTPKRRIGPIVAGVAGLLALVVGVAWIFGSRDTAPSAGQSPAGVPSVAASPKAAPTGGSGASEKPAPTIGGISCEAIAPTTAATQTAGRVSAGGLSYPLPGAPWPEPVTSDFAFPLVASGAVQMVKVADYGTAGWAAGLVIAELRQDPRITSVEQAAKGAAACLVATQYTVATFSEKRTRDEATTVDGASAWTIESTITLADPDLEVTSEHMTLVTVETKPGRYAMFWSSIPATTPDYTAVADACRKGLKVG